MDREISPSNPAIAITGFPYAYPYYRRVFDFFERKEDLAFLLPKFWSAKKGKVQIHFPGGYTALSYGGKSFLAGIFKGWMPGMILYFFRHHPQVLYSCSEPHLLTTLYHGLVTKLFGAKHVLFTWQNVPPEIRMKGLKLKLSNALVKLNLRLADGIICGNAKAADIIKHQNSNIKILICPLAGVDVEKFKPDPAIKKDYPPLILFAGALERRKGIHVLLEAVSKVSIDYQLLIVGTGPEKDQLHHPKAQFQDWVKNDELPALLNRASVFVYPSIPVGGWEEQFGYAMAEASACDVPVVASTSGSIDEVVKHGETGLLVPPNDPAALATALEAMLKRPLRNRIFIVNNFSHAVIAKKIENFLRSFI